MGEETKPDGFRGDVADAAFVGNRWGHWLCMRGLHRWGRWTDPFRPPGDIYLFQRRTCWRCNQIHLRKEKHF